MKGLKSLSAVLASIFDIFVERLDYTNNMIDTLRADLNDSVHTMRTDLSKGPHLWVAIGVKTFKMLRNIVKLTPV